MQGNYRKGLLRLYDEFTEAHTVSKIIEPRVYWFEDNKNVLESIRDKPHRYNLDEIDKAHLCIKFIFPILDEACIKILMIN